MNRHCSARFWVLAGPACLAMGFVLLLLKFGGGLGRPVWLFGLCVFMGIACFITYLAYQEVVDQQVRFRLQKGNQDNETTSLRETLEDTVSIYREKVQKLEDIIHEFEKEQQELQKGYEKVHHDCQSERVRAQSLQASLHDALDELREVRQIDFLKAEAGALLPPDLPAQHRQLREQFDEKSLVLNQTRRRLFGMEGQLLSMLKMQEEDKLSNPEELEILQRELEVLDTENGFLEEDIKHLEALVSQMIKPQAGKKDLPKKKVEQMLELQFDQIS